MSECESSFEVIWNHAQNFAPIEPIPHLCIYAQKFAQWAGELCINVAKNPHTVFVNQAKVMLVNQYFEWRNVVPAAHRNYLSNRGHFCIFQVFEEAFSRLQVVQLSISPPPMSFPPSSTSFPVGGTLIGLMDGGDDSSTS
jgi:hypothetical protein